jgi:hypothetical protein
MINRVREWVIRISAISQIVGYHSSLETQHHRMTSILTRKVTVHINPGYADIFPLQVASERS